LARAQDQDSQSLLRLVASFEDAAASGQSGQQQLGNMDHLALKMLFGFMTNDRRDCTLQQLHQLIAPGNSLT